MDILGITLSIIGFSIRAVAYIHLNGNFSWTVSKPKCLIDTGIYKHIRHPMYLGAIILYQGLVLWSTGNLFLSFIICSMVISFAMDRIQREDFLLFNSFGDKFLEYEENTPMLIPSLFFKKQR